MVTEKTVRFFDEIAPQRDFWIQKNRYYHQDISQFHQFVVPEGASVLELGCGTGQLLASLKSKRGVGIDSSPRMIKIASEKYPHLEFLAQDVESQTLDETFEFVILSNLVGYLSDIQATLANLQKNCRPSTRIILTFHNALWEPLFSLGEKLGWRMPQPEQNWVSVWDAKNLLELSGYEVIKSGLRLIFPWNIPLLSGFLNRFLAKIPGIRHLGITQYVIARPKLKVPHLGPIRTSVIIPAMNEEGNIRALPDMMPKLGDWTELVFVVGKSRDNTLEAVREATEKMKDRFSIQILEDMPGGQGKRDAVFWGFEHAKGDYFYILDADLTVRPEELVKFHEALIQNKAEFVMGSRLVYPMERDAMRFLNKMGNKFFSLFFSWVLNEPIRDTLCGTKVMSRENYHRIRKTREFFGDIDPFGDFEMILGASKLNLKMIQIPIRYKARFYGDTNIQRFKHGAQLLLLSIRAFARFKWYL